MDEVYQDRENFGHLMSALELYFRKVANKLVIIKYDRVCFADTRQIYAENDLATNYTFPCSPLYT